MKHKIMVYILLATMLLTGCKTEDLASTAENTTVEGQSTETVGTGMMTEHSNGLDPSSMFTDRDRENSYDQESSVGITLMDDNSFSDSDAVQIETDTITITDEGTYLLSGKLTNGMIIVDAEDTDKVQLVLDGVEITSEQSAALYVRSADKVFITTTEGSDNILTNGGTYAAIDDNNIDAAIFSKADLTLNGSGTLMIYALAGHGVVSKDDLVLTSGTYEITAEKHGLSGKDSVRIAEGTYHITAGQDGIHASNTEDSGQGFIYIAGGNFEIAVTDDGMHADSALMIEDGTIYIPECYEGLEGLSIDITGGDINVISSDDGLNAAGGNDSSGTAGGREDIFAAEEGVYIHISGGTLRVNASGDGIDSNGALIVSGGELYVSGPTNGANGSLDYNGESMISGGIFVATGSSGMAQNFDNSSTQGVIMVMVDTQAAGTTISLMDSSGKELVSWVAEQEYSSVIVSCPELTQGCSYTLTAGNSMQEITMDQLIYGSGGMGGQPGGMGGQPGGRMPGQGRPSDDGVAPGQSEPTDDGTAPPRRRVQKIFIRENIIRSKKYGV
ncbi:MAG: carbohydrate-binding domain-containing protein [Lachnospiraceae bacterium]